jgi:hypothetical protein
VAVDQSDGDVYVADTAAGAIYKFGPEGEPVDFAALGSNELEGLSFSDAEHGLVELAVNSSTHDLYVVENAPVNGVSVFHANGEAAEFSPGVGHTLSGFGELCGVAVDSEGDIYAADYEGGVSVFEASGASLTSAAVSHVCGIAVGPGGALYVNIFEGSVSLLTPSSFPVTGATTYDAGTLIATGPVIGVGVDPTNGDLYADERDAIAQYDGGGTLLGRSGSVGEGALSESEGVAVDGSDGRLFATAPAAGRAGSGLVFRYGPEEAEKPRIEAEWAASVDQTEATLKAQINPEGAATTYHLEYGTDTSYRTTTPEHSVGSDEAGHVVINSLEGLSAGTTYHYRFIATSSIGVSEGPDRTFTTESRFTPETNCPNQQFRTGASANLPDCRAYEMVSPVDKGNSDIKSACQTSCYRAQLDQSSIDGEKFTYGSYKSFGDSPSALYANQYMSTRGPGGWSNHSLNPPKDEGLFVQSSPTFDLEVQYKAFTGDLGTAWMTNDNVLPLTPDAPKDNVDIYSRDTANNSYTSLLPSSLLAGTLPNGATFEGYSISGSHSIFQAAAPLTPEAVNAGLEEGLYDFSGGSLSLVSVLPNGTPTSGDVGLTEGGSEVSKFSTWEHAISNDGSRIFWSHGGDLYVRIDGERTIPISVGEDARFRDASVDGSRMIFETPQNHSEYRTLHEFNVEREAATVIAGSVAGVVGASDDLSRVYFVSLEDLAAGASGGANNLYLDDNGAVTFIAQVSARDLGVGRVYPSIIRSPVNRASRVTPSGRDLAFESDRNLTGYNNNDAINGEPDIEVYVYDSVANHLICASCNPSGTLPVGQALREPYTASDLVQHYSQPNQESVVWAAAWLPSSESSLYSSRALSNSGDRLFFNSFDALVPRDTNGQQDVYEWVAPNVGECREANGCVGLISSGESAQRSELIDADPEGDNVFFETKSSLVSQDPGLIDIYDARVDGGFASPPVPPPGCEGEACQGPLAPPNDPTPGSSTFHGAGNLVRKVSHKKQKPKRHKKKKKAHKKKGHAASKHQASHNGRTTR